MSCELQGGKGGNCGGMVRWGQGIYNKSEGVARDSEFGAQVTTFVAKMRSQAAAGRTKGNEKS